MNNKGADQTAGLHRLVYAFVVPKPQETGFHASRPINTNNSSLLYVNIHILYLIQYLLMHCKLNNDMTWSLLYGLRGF